MKKSKILKPRFCRYVGVLTASLLLAGGLVSASAQTPDDKSTGVFVVKGDAPDNPFAGPKPKQLFLRTVARDELQANTKGPWIGVGVEDSSEPLTAQLGLKQGEGLIVNYVATNSPAGVAGLQRNDVLVEFDGQMLVDPVQLRKLVQMHADGDSVKIQYYRGGKKESITIKLVLHEAKDALFGNDVRSFQEGNKLYYAPKMPEPPELESGKLAIQFKQADAQAQLAMDQAKRVVAEAMEQSLNGTDSLNSKLQIMQKKIKDLSESGMTLRKDSTVVVKNDGESVRTIVKKDASGTYVIVADPAKRLTAHNTDGKLLFDGPIDGGEQQQKVPKEVWEKVEPMLDQLNDDPGEGAPTPAYKREER